MKITLPTDCGNAPRICIVGEFAVAWASGDAQSVVDWLTEDARWTLIGQTPALRGPDAAREAIPDFTPELIEITSVITHGRLASCDGYLEAGGRRLSFSHSLRFASTSKTAKIAELRSYCITH